MTDSFPIRSNEKRIQPPSPNTPRPQGVGQSLRCAWKGHEKLAQGLVSVRETSRAFQ